MRIPVPVKRSGRYGASSAAGPLAGGQLGGDQAGQAGGQGDAAVGDGDVEPPGSGQAADDRLAVHRHGPDADLIVGDGRLLEAADGAAGAVQESARPTEGLGTGRMQVYRGVGGLQVHQAALAWGRRASCGV